MRLLTTNRFEKDLKRALKRGKDLDKLWKIVKLLLDNKPLEKPHRSHPFSGNYATAWEMPYRARLAADLESGS